MFACPDKSHRPAWRVEVRNANYSAFNGGRRTPSAYSQLHCTQCNAVWRTRAAYVASIPDAHPQPSAPSERCARCDGPADTGCRICRRPHCRPCLTDHHHEGYGTPTAQTW
ncbi:hypothetical protein ACH4LK_22600 [Streptomyces lydicus]|uniref:hypothetical protein n=1 Tax=Streptomyces lydicus TaxID=47763 RepID=UPI00379E973C